MPDIFGRATPRYGGSFTSDGARVHFAGDIEGAGLLIQNISVNFQQAITRIWELSSNTTYYVGGRTSGQMGMTRVLGPAALSRAFYELYGDVCNIADGTVITLNFENSCLPDGESLSETTYQVRQPVITSLGVNMSAADMVISENVTMLFASLERAGV